MNNTPTIKEMNTELHLYVPYGLNAAFRAIYKTARWNPTGKVFVVKATSQNMNKWGQFIEAVKGVPDALAMADEAEATAAEVASAVREAQRLIENCQERAATAQRNKAKAEAQLAELSPFADEMQSLLAEVVATTEKVLAERDLVIAPVLKLYETNQLFQALDEMAVGARQGLSGKARCDRAQDKIIAVKRALKGIGVFVPAIDELANVSLNRPDKMLDGVEAARATHTTGIKRLARNSEVA
jgi:hypothetical protein